MLRIQDLISRTMSFRRANPFRALSLLTAVVTFAYAQPALAVRPFVTDDARVVGAANAQTETDLPTLTYASVYPVALIFKILLAQALVEILRHLL